MLLLFFCQKRQKCVTKQKNKKSHNGDFLT